MKLLDSISNLTNLMDDETFEHCCNVNRAAITIYGYLEEKDSIEKEILVNSCAVLDIGKTLINEYMFRKAESFSEIERELMNLHPYLGYKILLENQVPDKIAEVVLFHHGRDAPHLTPIPVMTEEVSVYAKIIHTVDVFEALRENRNRRPRYSAKEAYEKMKDNPEYHKAVTELLYKENL